MKKLGDFQGLCPVCYKPVKTGEDSRELLNGDRKEIYHAPCLHQFVKQNAPKEPDKVNIGLSLLEQYKQLLIRDNPKKRQEWVESQSNLWQVRGEIIKKMREHLGCSITSVARQFGISVSRLKRFEAGEPIRDAKLLEHTYYIWVFGESLKRHYNGLYHEKYGCDYYMDTNGNIFETLLPAASLAALD